MILDDFSTDSWWKVYNFLVLDYDLTTDEFIGIVKASNNFEIKSFLMLIDYYSIGKSELYIKDKCIFLLEIIINNYEISEGFYEFRNFVLIYHFVNEIRNDSEFYRYIKNIYLKKYYNSCKNKNYENFLRCGYPNPSIFHLNRVNSSKKRDESYNSSIYYYIQNDMVDALLFLSMNSNLTEGYSFSFNEEEKKIFRFINKDLLCVAAFYGSPNCFFTLIDMHYYEENNEKFINNLLECALLGESLIIIKYLIYEKGLSFEKHIHTAVKYFRNKSLECILSNTEVKSLSPLFSAFKYFNLPIIGFLLRSEIDYSSDQNSPALHKACYFGLRSVVKLLVQKGCKTDCHSNMETPLCITSKSNYDLVSYFVDLNVNINQTDYYGNTPFMLAASSGNVQICNILFVENVSLIKQNLNGDTALHLAAKGGHYEVCKFICQHNVNVNAQNYSGLTPLHYAALSASVQICELLIENSADVNAVNYRSVTPLLIACEKSSFEVVQLLLRYGANPRIKEKETEEGPLHFAAKHSNLMICKELIENSLIDINDENIKGDNCFHKAAEAGSYELYVYFLEKGMNEKYSNKDGFSPLDKLNQFKQNLTNKNTKLPMRNYG